DRSRGGPRRRAGRLGHLGGGRRRGSGGRRAPAPPGGRRRAAVTVPRLVGDLGEFELIDRLAARLPTGDGVVVGIGDDTAALAVSPGHLLLATTDGQVEGVHFLRDGTPPRAVGHRALASNLSDVAAMGGRARWAIVALTL